MTVQLGDGVDDDIECLRAIGKALQGMPVRLMVDDNRAWRRAAPGLRADRVRTAPVRAAGGLRGSAG